MNAAQAEHLGFGVALDMHFPLKVLLLACCMPHPGLHDHAIELLPAMLHVCGAGNCDSRHVLAGQGAGP